ncbi:MAG: class II aldolase/adducin family protein [archaeon]
MTSTVATDDEAREMIAKKGREILDEGLTQKTSGNVSVRVDDERIAISPSGVPYHEIEPEDVPIVDLDGEQVGDGEPPSSETPMHTEAYRRRPDVGGVVHTHSPYATTFASLGRPIEPSHYLIAFAGKEVPVAEYATNGTPELAKEAMDTMGDTNAVLLRNHGVLAVGPTLDDAHNVAARVEYVGRIHWQASILGEPELVGSEELDDLMDYFQDYS